MSLSITQLRSMVQQIYPEVEQLSDTTLRFKRRANNSEFAVYYLDLGKDLPHTHDTLSDYLNRVIGGSYFEGPSSLQWNHYLYFIRPAEQFQDHNTQKAKELIEHDRVYARKFVIPESELDSVLHPKTPEARDAEKAPDVMAKWVSILKEANLLEAVFGEHTMPKRMKLALNPKGTAPSEEPSATKQSGTLLPPIRLFEIGKFERPAPIQTSFSFGNVNLLFGANGSGKTSLLEAIELFYCNKTRRNPTVGEQYRFNVVVNGEPELASHKKLTNKVLRARNLDWYGVREVRSTKVYDGFGRFNFLNTDAALELSQSTGNIDEHLAQLLVGSEASKTWQDIGKFVNAVDAELRKIQEVYNQVKRQLDLANSQLADISTITKESDSLRSALDAALERNQWAITDNLDAGSVGIVAELVELYAALEQARELSWLDAPVTLRIIEHYIQTINSIIQTCAQNVEELKSLQVDRQRLAKTVQQYQEAATLIGELGRLVASGVEERTSELGKQREIVDTFSNLTAGLDDEILRVVAEAADSISVADYQESAVAAREKSEEALRVAKREYKDFADLRDHSLSLAQELRAIAAKILEVRPSDECPLCHTKFQPGDLAQHITIGVDDHLESRAQQLLEQVEHAEAAVSSALRTEKAANQIYSLCERLQLPPSTPVNDVTVSLKDAMDAQVEARKRAEELESEIKAVETRGLTLARLNEVSARLSALGIQVHDRSPANADLIRSDVKQRLVSLGTQMESNARKEKQLLELVIKSVGTFWPGETDPSAAMAQLNERLAATSAVLTTVRRFAPRFSWDESRPIAEWAVEVESVRSIATQLQAALDKERIATKNQSDARLRKDRLQQEEKEKTSQINRWKEVQAALKEIQTKHSLTSITESALQANRTSIEMTFSQIHSPAEFETIDRDWKLVRKHDGKRTPLTQISTGQRAAFALAVFLAQNAQLRVGPRVILIDDPIAHVDDLNCLSFLDYLREIALTGERQIFFATASDKLASLFERKFDFLGDGFKRIHLTR